jgi:hypothetical protein
VLYSGKRCRPESDYDPEVGPDGWSEGCGTLYELIPASGGGWNETVLHAFDNNGKDGVTPGSGDLLMDISGNLYGTTETGGRCGGVVYEITPKATGGWKETILYDFKMGASGWFPGAGVVMDKGGTLYGTRRSTAAMRTVAVA